MKCPPEPRSHFFMFAHWSVKERSMPPGGHFGCACVYPLNDNSAGASNLMAGKSKTGVKLYSPFKSHFVGDLNTGLSCFLCGFSVVDFSAIGFLDLLKT